MLFPGQYFDSETGLHQNYFRDYDPKTGRYIEPDPIGQIGGINLYPYAKNNSLNLFDTYGLTAGVEVIGIAIPKIPVPPPILVGIGAFGAGYAIGNYINNNIIEPWLWEENNSDSDKCPIPDNPSNLPGEGWEWKGSGPPESGKGNWVNDKTGQRLHPDLKHPAPKGPHWGLTNPDGSKWDYFPGKGWIKQ